RGHDPGRASAQVRRAAPLHRRVGDRLLRAEHGQGRDRARLCRLSPHGRGPGGEPEAGRWPQGCGRDDPPGSRADSIGERGRMNQSSSALLTDLYQLTMLQGYLTQRMEETAVFECFVRKLPPRRGFLVAAGLEQALSYLEPLGFTPWELDWIAKSGRFSAALVEYLTQFRFTGDVHAMPEGTVFFPDEPILRVTAPLPQAQLVETRLINLLHFQTL